MVQHRLWEQLWVLVEDRGLDRRRQQPPRLGLGPHDHGTPVPGVTKRQTRLPDVEPRQLPDQRPKLTMAAERVTLLQIALLPLHRQDDGNDPDPLMVLQQGAQLQWPDRYAQAVYAPAAYGAKEMLIPRIWLQP